MEKIIADLLTADNAVILKATNDLQEAYKHPNAITQLCQIAISHKEPQFRQYAAVLMRKRLAKLRNWQMVPSELRQRIKEGMLNALVQETEKSVRNAVAQFVGIVMRHESESQDSWMNSVLEFLFTNISSADPKQRELGASVFSTMADVAPDQFVPHMESICQMFNSVMVSSDKSGNLASPVVYNIMIGMTYLVPFILGHNTAEHTYQKSVPNLLKALHELAAQNKVDEFVRAFDILEGMADYTPKLLTSNVKLLLEFCLQIAKNPQYDAGIRIKTVSFLGWLVRLKKKIILKQKMIEPILQVVFNLMSSASDDIEEDEEYFLGEESSTPMTTATQTMDLLALNIPPERLIPPLLALLEPALQGHDPLPRRAAYLSMAVIAEGCSDAICTKYLPTMLSIVKIGIRDVAPLVRNAAFFALGQFSEHLQPKISEYAPEILPILFEFLHHLCHELRGGGTEPKHIDRMFYALETFCENLETALAPHLPVLMERLFEALDPNNSVRVRELSFATIAAAANATKENMVPYFSRLVSIMNPYLSKDDDKENSILRPAAIDTLAAIARTIGKENFLPLAGECMKFSLALLDGADDPDLRRALYNLIASLSEVVGEDMGAIYPKIMDRIYESILTTEEVVPRFKDDVLDEIPDNLNDEIDIEDSDEEDDDDDDNVAGYGVENSYLDEKEEAILALKEFAENSGAAFLPYLEQSYQNVYKMIDHPQEDIRKVSIDSLTAFIIALYKQKEIGVSTAANIFIPKVGKIVHEDDEISVVITALDCFGDLLKELKSDALTTDETREIIFTCIEDVIKGKVACQCDDDGAGGDDEDDEESEYDEAIVESAGNIFSLFGRALPPDQFSMYFGRIAPLLIQKLQKAKNKEEFENQRSFAYGVMAECFAPLGKFCAQYFDTLCQILIEGFNDQFEQARQNAVYALGELVLHSKEKSFTYYPLILTALSQAVSKETHPPNLDNICGAIARLIVTNSSLVPLSDVLPVFLQKLPLREDFDENDIVFKCFKLLYIQKHDTVVPYLEQILAIAIHVLYKEEFVTPEAYQNIISLVNEIRENYPSKYAAIANTNPDIHAFMQHVASRHSA